MNAAMKDKQILVAGLGKSGLAAMDTLLKEGAILSVYDDRDIEKDEPELFARLKEAHADCFLNGTAVEDRAWDMIVLSPGVPLSLPFVVNAKKQGAKVIGEIELAYILGRGKYAAITGTNGKTTTITLIGELFTAAGLETFVVGNIGTPVVSKAVIASDDNWLVTEVSSFQLETIEMFKPKIAALLNITPEHLDRHETMENYAAAKARIFENQDEHDFLVYNADDQLVASLVATAKSKKVPFSRLRSLETGAFVMNGMVVYSENKNAKPIDIVRVEKLQIPGAHNLENILAATAIAFAAGIKPEVISKALISFKGVEHRIEFVTEIDGIGFVNDSKGTNPDASIKAIEALGEKSEILLIAGGYDKNADFSEFISMVVKQVKKLILIGATSEMIKEKALLEGFPEKEIVMAENMGDAVQSGLDFANAGDTVLLSPACASWDMYENFEERGSHFKSLVRDLEMKK